VSAASVAIVTGAGSGIGRGAAGLLAAAGWRVALVGRGRAALERVARDAGSSAAERTLVLARDVGRPDDARAIVVETVARWGRLDALVSNAGTAPVRDIEATDEALLAEVFAVNAFGPALAIARAWPTFVRQRSGVIVNVSSMAAVDPFPGFFVYAASKAAVASLVRSAAREGAAIGVRAYAVAPGAVETPMLRAIVSEDDLPRSATLDPAGVARVIVECVLGHRPEPSGSTILMPSG
jgi:NAD(P)-dependent dehydrogenase (short-subunit alcohol dehydrogenase family)